MSANTEFGVGRFLERFASSHDIEYEFFGDFSRVGIRLLNGDFFYFELGSCPYTITMFFCLVNPCILTEHELFSLNESLDFSEINSVGNVVVSDDHGLVYFNVVVGEVVDDESLDVSVGALLTGYKKLTEWINFI